MPMCGMCMNTLASQNGVFVCNGGLIVNVTEPSFIMSLNATSICWFVDTFSAPSSGIVTMMLGLSQSVMNLNGFLMFGFTGFGMRGFPSTSVPVTVTLYTVHIGNACACVPVSLRFPFDQDQEKIGLLGLTVGTTELGSIASTKSMMIGALRATSI